MKKIIIILWLISSLLISCRRDPLYYENRKKATIRLLINWDDCTLTPHGTTTYIYDKKNGRLACASIISDNTEYIDISLHSGEYYIIVVNDTDDDLHNVDFIGINNINDFHVKVCTNSYSKYKFNQTSVPTTNYANDCDIIAIAEIDNLIITNNDIIYYSREPNEHNHILKVIPITAKRITEKIKIVLTVNNISSAAGAPNCRFTNLSGGYNFYGKNKLNMLINHEFSINTRSMFKSGEDKAIISKEIITFGPHFTKATYTNIHHLQINFYLTDGTTHYQEIETNNIMQTHNDGLQNAHEVAATITLPKSIGNGDGPFGSEIEEWDDVDLTIPIE